jgi:hypothetical protein
MWLFWLVVLSFSFVYVGMYLFANAIDLTLLTQAGFVSKLCVVRPTAVAWLSTHSFQTNPAYVNSVKSIASASKYIQTYTTENDRTTNQNNHIIVSYTRVNKENN